MPDIPAEWDGKDPQGNPLRWDTPGLTYDSLIQQQSTPHIKMPILHVLTGFDKNTDHEVEDTGGAVSVNFFGNPAYPDPPFTKVVFDAALTAFSTAIPAAKQGGPADTAAKNNLRAALIDMLRQLAGYVQLKHGNNLATLLSSGYKNASTNRAQSALPAPVISGILNGSAGQLLPQIATIPNAAGYEPRYAIIGPDGKPGPWQAGQFAPNTRALAINGLTPGTIYIVQVRALGGSTNYSDWSDPVQHMAM